MDHHNNRIIAKDLRTMDQQFPVPSFDNVLGPSPLEEMDVDALSLRKVEDWLAADTGVTLLRDYRRYGSNIEYLFINKILFCITRTYGWEDSNFSLSSLPLGEVQRREGKNS